MRKVHEKSIILGIGIGMIITSIAGMIYAGGAKQELSEEEIKRLARGYGMVEQVQLLNGNDTAENTAARSSVAEDTSPPAVDTQKTAQSTGKPEENKPSSGTGERNINIEVKPGNDSTAVVRMLLEKEVITSEKAFNDLLSKYGTSTKINVGTYKFRKNDDLDYIVKTICMIK